MPATDCLVSPAAVLPSNHSRRWYRAVYSVPSWKVVAVVVLLPSGPVAVSFLRHGELWSAATVLLALGLTAATLTDLFWRRIFNWVPLGLLGWVGALHVSAAGVTWTGLPSATDSVAGFLVCGVVMTALYLIFRGGEGDVKLVAALGAVLGPWHGTETLMFGYMAAAAATATSRLCVRIGLKSLAFPTSTLPMAPFFSFGVLLTLGWSPC